MYDLETTRQAVALASEKLGFELVYHSLEEIEEMRARLEGRQDKRGIVSPKLKADELRFIQNERALCAIDFRNYWLPRYSYIVRWDKPKLAAFRAAYPQLAR